MTKREKQFVMTGILFGMLLAAVFYGVSRHLHGGAGKVDAVTVVQARESEPDPPSQVADSGVGETVSAVQLTIQEQQQIGVQTVEAQRRILRRTLSTVAQVEQPETGLTSVSARISGRIDKLFVDFTGQPVRQGQEIALIYSPDIFSTAEEYRLALENRKRLGSGAESQAISGAEDLVAASRRRLELWGVTPQQIGGIASSSKPQIDLPIYSPASGIVTERKVAEGQYVSAGGIAVHALRPEHDVGEGRVISARYGLRSAWVKLSKSVGTRQTESSTGGLPSSIRQLIRRHGLLQYAYRFPTSKCACGPACSYKSTLPWQKAATCSWCPDRQWSIRAPAKSFISPRRMGFSRAPRCASVRLLTSTTRFLPD